MLRLLVVAVVSILILVCATLVMVGLLVAGLAPWAACLLASVVFLALPCLDKCEYFKNVEDDSPEPEPEPATIL